MAMSGMVPPQEMSMLESVNVDYHPRASDLGSTRDRHITCAYRPKPTCVGDPVNTVWRPSGRLRPKKWAADQPASSASPATSALSRLSIFFSAATQASSFPPRSDNSSGGLLGACMLLAKATPQHRRRVAAREASATDRRHVRRHSPSKTGVERPDDPPIVPHALGMTGSSCNRPNTDLRGHGAQ